MLAAAKRTGRFDIAGGRIYALAPTHVARAGAADGPSMISHLGRGHRDLETEER